MRRVYLTLTTVLFLFVAAQAQQTQPSESKTVFTRDECIQYALEHSPTSKNSKLDEQIADARVKEIRGIGLPQIDAAVGLTHNHKLPRFFLQYNPDPNGGGSPFGDLGSIPGMDPGEVAAMQNFFQLKSGGNAAVTINQILFNGSYIVALQATGSYRDLAVKSSQLTRENIIEQVLKAYYAVLINKDRIRLFDINVSRIDSLLKTTTALNENGFAEKIDVDRIKVQANNLRTQRNNFVNLQELGIQALKFQMNYPTDQPLDVTGDIASLKIDENLLENYPVNWDYKQRSDYQVMEANKRLSELDVKNKLSESVPSLNAFANLGYSTQSPDIAGLFKTNSSFTENPGIGVDRWYGFSSFGVSLNVPIFSGLQRTYRLQQAKLNLIKAENGIENLRAGIDLEIKNASINYVNSIADLKSQLENRELAENIARVTKIKFEQGVGSNIEVTDAESSLETAQINYYDALYKAVVAKIDLEKAYGKLNPIVTAEQNKAQQNK